MYKKTIKYADYDGNVREETHLFNLNKAELISMEISAEGGLEKMLTRIIDEQDGAKIIAFFEELVEKSYGRKSLDGKRFEKSKEIFNEFKQTEAYSELFYSLVTDTEECVKFVKGIVPNVPNALPEK